MPPAWMPTSRHGESGSRFQNGCCSWMKRSSGSGRSTVPASTSRSRSKLSTRPLVVVAVVIAIPVPVELVDLVLEVLVDLLALDLERRGQLALLLRELAREHLELLDLLDVGQVGVGVVDRLLDRGLVGPVLVLFALLTRGDQRDHVGPV